MENTVKTKDSNNLEQPPTADSQAVAIPDGKKDVRVRDIPNSATEGTIL